MTIVEEYLGKKVIVDGKSGIGRVYAILIRPPQYKSLLKVAFGDVNKSVISLDEVYANCEVAECTVDPLTVSIYESK